MGVCPGCGRCRECGQPAPVSVPVYPTWPHAPIYPSPTTSPPWSPPYYVGDPTPGSPGTITITCSTGNVL